MAKTSAKPNLRAAKMTDASSVAKLLSQLGYECTADDAAERISIIRDESRQMLLVADLNGDICGLLAVDFMYFLPMGRVTCRITALIVSEQHRHSGLGRSLIKEAELLARAQGAARIEVTTANHRHEAHHFYRNCGYEESSIRFMKRLGDA
jgi:ribosomal protein S18 acetylase RimI-like enzyme